MPDTAEDILREADAVAADNAALRDQIEAYGGYYCYLAVPCQYAYYEDAYPAYLENRAASPPPSAGAPGHGGAGHRPMWTWARSLMPRAICRSSAQRWTTHYGLRGAYVTYRAAAERLAADGCALRVPEEGRT